MQSQTQKRNPVGQNADVLCGLCFKPNKRRNLPRHFTNKHLGIKPFEAPPKGYRKLMDTMVKRSQNSNVQNDDEEQNQLTAADEAEMEANRLREEEESLQEEVAERQEEVIERQEEEADRQEAARRVEEDNRRRELEKQQEQEALREREEKAAREREAELLRMKEEQEKNAILKAEQEAAVLLEKQREEEAVRVMKEQEEAASLLNETQKKEEHVHSAEIPTEIPQQNSLPPCMMDVDTCDEIAHEDNICSHAPSSGSSNPRKRPRSQENYCGTDVSENQVNLREEIMGKLNEIQKDVQAVSNEALAAKLDDIQKQLENISLRNLPSEILRKKLESQKCAKQGGYDQAKMDHARTAENTKDFVNRLDNVEFHYPTLAARKANEPDGIYCTDCAQEVAPSSHGQFPGVVRFSEIGEERENLKGFQNMKAHMANHIMKSKCHAKNIAAKNKTTEMAEKERKSLNETAGMNCSRIAYNCITRHHSYNSYEMEVTLANANNTYVGHKNHSREYCRDMVDHFYDALVDRLQHQMTQPLEGTGRPSPLSIDMDKYTANHRTYNVTGVNAYSSHGLKTYFLDAYVVDDHTGDGIGSSVVKSTDTILDDEWKKRYVGTCSDGAMLNLNYKKKLDRLVNEGSGKTDLANDFYSHSWDAAHVVELANKDVGVNKGQHKWVQQVQGTITELNHKYMYGKKREEAIKTAEEADEHLYAPKGWSNTRWSAYASSTFENTYKNYRSFYKSLDNDQDEMLDKINCSDYVLRATVLTDIAKERSKLSKTVQIPDIYYWNVNKTVNETCNNLSRMAEALDDPNVLPENLNSIRSSSADYKLLPKFSDAIDELRASNSHQEMPILDNEHFPVGNTTRGRADTQAQTSTLESKIDRVRQQASSYIKSEVAALQERFDEETNQIMDEAANCFDLDEVLKRESSVIPESLKNYVDACNNAKLLDKHPQGPPPAWHEVKDQFKKFQSAAHSHVSQKYQAAKDAAERRKIEKGFYEELLLKGRHGAEQFRDVNQLLATATVRLRNESQIESMASQLKRIAENRPLEPSKIAREGFLTRNGPPPNQHANSLLRDATNRKFKGTHEKWNFVEVTRPAPDGLKLKPTSKVIGRINEEEGRVLFGKPK